MQAETEEPGGTLGLPGVLQSVRQLKWWGEHRFNIIIAETPKDLLSSRNQARPSYRMRKGKWNGESLEPTMWRELSPQGLMWETYRKMFSHQTGQEWPQRSPVKAWVTVQLSFLHHHEYTEIIHLYLTTPWILRKDRENFWEEINLHKCECQPFICEYLSQREWAHLRATI